MIGACSAPVRFETEQSAARPSESYCLLILLRLRLSRPDPSTALRFRATNSPGNGSSGRVERFWAKNRRVRRFRKSGFIARKPRENKTTPRQIPDQGSFLNDLQRNGFLGSVPNLLKPTSNVATRPARTTRRDPPDAQAGRSSQETLP